MSTRSRPACPSWMRWPKACSRAIPIRPPWRNCGSSCPIAAAPGRSRPPSCAMPGRMRCSCRASTCWAIWKRRCWRRPSPSHGMRCLKHRPSIRWSGCCCSPPSSRPFWRRRRRRGPRAPRSMRSRRPSPGWRTPWRSAMRTLPGWMTSCPRSCPPTGSGSPGSCRSCARPGRRSWPNGSGSIPAPVRWRCCGRCARPGPPRRRAIP